LAVVFKRSKKANDLMEEVLQILNKVKDGIDGHPVMSTYNMVRETIHRNFYNNKILF
jgi:hypothetical protein